MVKNYKIEKGLEIVDLQAPLRSLVLVVIFVC